MSWFADYTITYNGKDNNKFIKLAKLLIPDYENRFKENEEKNMIDCIKDLQWDSADVDIAKIMEYLGENDSLDVIIHGESGPYLKDEDGEYIMDGDGEYQELECEKQIFRKQKGEVVIDNEHPNDDRVSYDELGIYYDIEDLKTYIGFITREIGPDDEMMPIVQSIIPDVLSRFDESDNEIIELKSKFANVETTKEFFCEMYEKQRSLIEQKVKERQGVPSFLTDIPKNEISELGGVEQLKKLVELFGEEPSKALLRTIGVNIPTKITDKRIGPGELIKMLTTTKEQLNKSPLQEREDKLSKLEQEEQTITETERLLAKQQEISEPQMDK